MEGRLVVVSNRLPVAARQEADGWVLQPSPGGLVTALSAVLPDRKGLWIGWPGVAGDVDLEAQLREQSDRFGFELHGVPLSEEEREKFYHGFSNEVIWPLFHDLQTFCNFDPEYWHAYERVNDKFAEHVAAKVQPGDFVWIHDYHLMNLGHDLRGRGVTNPLGFFLHIPFPPRDLFVKLPWRGDVMRALLEFDLIGFQTAHDVENFIWAVQGLDGGPQVRRKADGTVILAWKGRQVRVGSFPISIDSTEVRTRAASEAVEERARLVRQRVPDRQFLLGVDRLDYTKGIPAKIRAFRRALEKFPELRERVTLLQIVSPSREAIPQYQALREEVERLVGEVNGEFYTWGWVPIHYVHRNVSFDELLAWYRVAEVALITPLRDGMNLVAKEYCASKVNANGVLVLSEFAGAADELKDGAILVNPYNVDQVANAIHEGLTQDVEVRRQRMQHLQAVVREHDVHRWVDAYLAAAPGQPATAPTGASR